MMRATAPVPFAGSPLDGTHRVCAFFNGNDEQYRVLLPFIKDGFFLDRALGDDTELLLGVIPFAMICGLGVHPRVKGGLDMRH